ncbi:helix-turn-helix domain-containing protein [Arthrobacter sp. SA17]
MQGLVWRLKALDPEASESLKVIAYFDALVDGHASAQVLLSGAAVLSGCPAGYVSEGNTVRVEASGTKTAVGAPAPGAPDGGWPGHAFGDGGRVWIERSGPAFANDEMILERVAIALGISFDRTSPVAASRRAVETLLDGAAPLDRRMDAAAMLHLDRRTSYRVVAVPVSMELAGPSAVIYTAVGPVRAAVLRSSTTETVDAQSPRPGSTAGVGLAMTPESLHRSWATALLALRLSSQRHPRQLADDLGSLLVFAEAADTSSYETPDLHALKRLVKSQPKALTLLDSIAETTSLRAVAEEIGLHHSSVQTRAAEYSTALGFDIRTAAGRVRLSLVLTLWRLAGQA